MIKAARERKEEVAPRYDSKRRGTNAMGTDSNGAMGGEKAKRVVSGKLGPKKAVVVRSVGRRRETAAKGDGLLKKLARAKNVQELLAPSDITDIFESAMAERDKMDGALIIGYRYDGGYKIWTAGLTTSQILAVVDKVRFAELLNFFGL